MEASTTKYQPTEEEKEKLYQNILSNASRSGYFLNPDKEYTILLMNGLLINDNRYGYQSCPCRLSTGIKENDLDIVCPCDYRDPDLSEFGMCYCGLYVSKDIFDNNKEIVSIPERRIRPAASFNPHGKSTDSPTTPLPTPPAKDTTDTFIGADALSNHSLAQNTSEASFAKDRYPVWRCKVCGYLCARDNPPELCPICKATKERFERFS